MTEQVPSIGRVVHYVTQDGRHVPADICEVEPHTWSATLFVKDPGDAGAGFQYGISFHAEGVRTRTWHWPEYVPPKGESNA